MRRWNGSVGFWNVSLTLLPLDDDNARLSRILLSTTDQICQALVDVLYDHVLPQDTSYVWFSNANDMNSINDRIQGANNAASHWLIQHRLRAESIFTFVTFGPTREQARTR